MGALFRATVTADRGQGECRVEAPQCHSACKCCSLRDIDRATHARRHRPGSAILTARHVRAGSGGRGGSGRGGGYVESGGVSRLERGLTGRAR